MAIEGRPFPRQAPFVHEPLQALAQRASRLPLPANTYRKMAAARENPDVSFQLRQKLDIDTSLLAGHVVTQSGHGIGRSELGAHVAQRVASAGSDDAEI